MRHAHDNDPEPYDSSDDENDEPTNNGDDLTIGVSIEDNATLKSNMGKKKQDIEIVWCDNTTDLVNFAEPFEQSNTLGHWILSKSEAVAYIAQNGPTFKIKYSDYQTYP